MSYIATSLFVLVGVINLLPVSGVVSDRQLASLYRIQDFGSDISLLLRHRAVLFGIVGALLVYAAFEPSVRGLATAAGLFSMVSFCALAFSLQTGNPSLIRIAWIDVLASVALLVAFGIHRVTLEGIA